MTAWTYAMLWLGGLIGCVLIVAVHLLYHWWWMRCWDRDHKGCCR